MTKKGGRRPDDRASVALTVAHFNFCKVHSAIRMTPAMKAGVATRPWSVTDLLAA